MGVAALTESIVIDGRFQLLRRLGGSAVTPLFVASDLQTGAVVCLRLWQFTASIAAFDRVPPLAPSRWPSGDGPLLPYDFGVDDDVAYLVRPYVSGRSLAAEIASSRRFTDLDAVRLVRRIGASLLLAHEYGFAGPGVQPDSVILGADGTVRTGGFDRVGGRAQSPDAGASINGAMRADGAALVSLLLQLFGTGPSGLPADDVLATTRVALPRQHPANPCELLSGRRNRTEAGSVRGACAAWPSLRDLVEALERTEARLRGRRPSTVWFNACRSVAASAVRRGRHLGPLLLPYLIATCLLTGTALLAVGAVRGNPTDPRNLVVYTLAAPVYPAGPSMAVLRRPNAAPPAPGARVVSIGAPAQVARPAPPTIRGAAGNRTTSAVSAERLAGVPPRPRDAAALTPEPPPPTIGPRASGPALGEGNRRTASIHLAGVPATQRAAGPPIREHLTPTAAESTSPSSSKQAPSPQATPAKPRVTAGAAPTTYPVEVSLAVTPPANTTEPPATKPRPATPTTSPAAKSSMASNQDATHR